MRSIVRDATARQEAKLMQRQPYAKDVLLPHGESVYTGEKQVDTSAGGDATVMEMCLDPADDLDGIRERRMRALRQAAQEKRLRQRQGFGEYCLVQKATMSSQLSPQFVSIVHVVGDDAATALTVDEHLRAMAPRYPTIKFLRAQDAADLPESLAQLRPPPLLLAARGTQVLAVLSTTSDDEEPEERIDSWMSRFQERREADEELSENDECAESYCGKPGCSRRYPHEHVPWRRPEDDVESAADSQASDDVDA